MDFNIFYISSLIVAVSSILGAVYKLYLFIHNLENELEEYKKAIDNNTRYVLKMALLSEELPIAERLEAGQKYLEMHGNGYCKAVYNKLLKDVEEDKTSL